MRASRTRPILIAAAALLFGGGTLPAQSTDSVTVVPGPRYESRGWLHEAVLGRRYRPVWTTPVTVPVLDLERFAGGLTPVRRGGNVQTLAIRFEGADGREYNFRSADKELTPALPPFAQETFVDWVRQDQTSAQLPAAPIVATALLDAVGVLNPGPRLVVLPDHPRLGEFREEFAGMFGTIEVHADEGPDDQRLFHDAEVVAGTDRLLEHLAEDLDDRVDARAFLHARLMDVFIGDWDRHEGQWRWARYDDDDGLRWWLPVPEDRDYAFVAYDGIGLELARRFGIVRLVEFGDDYADLLAMVDNSLELTKRILGELPYEVWETTARELQQALTDEVIRDAVRRMPPAHVAAVGDELESMLLARRDALHLAARDFFRLLNAAAEVHASELNDDVRVLRHPDGSLEVTVLIGGDPGFPPRFQRRFLPAETEEVRVYLYEGDDVAVVEGEGSDIVVRIIGGAGDDTLHDASEGPTAFYDAYGENRIVRGPDTEFDGRPSIWPDSESETANPNAEVEEEEEEDADAQDGGEDGPDAPLLPRLPLDWGDRFSPFGPTVEWRPAAELVVGGGPRFTSYGFRHRPYARRLELTGLYAPLHTRFGVEARAELRRENSRSWVELSATASQLDATHFRGFGNDTPALGSDASRVWHDRATVEAALHTGGPERWQMSVGALAEYVDPRPDPGSPAAALPGAHLRSTRRLGATANARIDLRDDPVFPRRGASATLSARAYAPLLDAAGAAGHTSLLATGYLPLPRSVLALRAGGSAAIGDYLFHDAAFLGGSRSLRGFPYQRFAGDESVFAGAELRVPVTKAELLVRGDLGVSAFADAGRVFVDGDSPAGWHHAIGGSVWFAVPLGVLNLSYARGEGDRLYLHVGLPY